MSVLVLVFMVVAAVFFAIAALNVDAKVNAVGAGLFFLTLAFIVGRL